MQGLSLVVASRGHSSSRCAGLSPSRPLLLRSTGSSHTGSVVVVHGPSCSAACGIFPDQGSNLCPLHWQADSQPLRHQGSPYFHFYSYFLFSYIYLNWTQYDHVRDRIRSILANCFISEARNAGVHIFVFEKSTVDWNWDLMKPGCDLFCEMPLLCK